jgi:hypothetical protein
VQPTSLLASIGVSTTNKDNNAKPAEAFLSCRQVVPAKTVHDKAEMAELHTVLTNDKAIACGINYPSDKQQRYYKQRQ